MTYADPLWHRRPVATNERHSMNLLTQTALDIARGFVGVRETGGNNRGPEVEAWLARVGLPPGNAWCMAFAWCCVQDAFSKLELPNPIRPCASVVRM